MRNWVRKNTGCEVEEKIGENSVPYLSFTALEKTGLVKHGFSTKFGGVSTGDFESMNLSISKPDKPENVKENFRRITKAIGIEYDSLCLSYQIHSTNVKPVGEEDRGLGIIKDRPYNDIDGLITNSNKVSLVTFFADCIPLFFVDTKNKAIGLSHSGWRGTVGKMAQVTLNAMADNYNSSPSDIILCIGPGICKDCYEVSSDVYEEFKKNFNFCDINTIISPNKKGRYQLDLYEANRQLALNIGIPEENIHVSDICTHCNSEYLFSHRKHGDRRGNLAAFLALK